jgi:DNA invertase Pin-like site-specific DNA recombinase
VGYARVSTAEQHASGAGLTDQRSAIRSECERRGWKLQRIYEDSNGVSGKNMRRPALLDALEVLSSGRAQVLIASKLDRLSRSLHDFTGLLMQAETEGWKLVALDMALDTSTPAGEVMANVVAAFSQYERRLIGERTRRALAVKRAEGVQLGRPRTVPAEVAEYIASLREQGLTLQAIADTLNDEGVPRGQAGARWWPSTVSEILKRG